MKLVLAMTVMISTSSMASEVNLIVSKCSYKEAGRYGGSQYICKDKTDTSIGHSIASKLLDAGIMINSDAKKTLKINYDNGWSHSIQNGSVMKRATAYLIDSTGYQVEIDKSAEAMHPLKSIAPIIDDLTDRAPNWSL